MMNPAQTILVVDDSENDLLLLESALQQADFGVRVQKAYDGTQAIAYLKGEGQYSDRLQYPMPAAILLDLNMPKKDGFDVLVWRRTRPELKSIPIVILTASLRMEDVERSADLGAQSYLVKPASLRELISMLRCLGDWLRINHYPPHNPWVNTRR